MAEGMKRNVYYNGDPTYTEASKAINREAREHECSIRCFFEGLRSDGNKIQSLRAIIEQYRLDLSGLSACRYDKEPVSGSHASDLSDILIKIEEKLRSQHEQLIKLYNSLADKRSQAYKYISMVSNEEKQSILLDRYIRCTSWERIAREHHYDKRHCIRLRDEAFRLISEHVTKCHF